MTRTGTWLAALVPSLVLGTCLVAGCSSLGEGGAPIALEFLVPQPAVVEIDDTIQLRARVLDQAGDSIAATIRWRTPDTTVAVDSISGNFWGILAGTGKVQPTSGSLVGFLASFLVRTRTDTIIVDSAAQSLLVVLATDTASAPLGPMAAQTSGTGLSGRALIITLVAPTGGAVRLSGDVVADTVTTGADGRPAVPIRVRKVGTTAGDSAIVQVESRRPSGAVVPGSGQKIRVFFQ